MSTIDQHLHGKSAVHRILSTMPYVLCATWYPSGTRHKSPKSRFPCWNPALGPPLGFLHASAWFQPQPWVRKPEPCSRSASGSVWFGILGFCSLAAFSCFRCVVPWLVSSEVGHPITILRGPKGADPDRPHRIGAFSK